MGSLLGVPEDMEVVIYMPLGKPAGIVPPPQKIPFGERAFFNRYGNAEE